MTYEVYSTFTYDKKYKLGVKIDSEYFTNIQKLGTELEALNVTNTKEFIKYMKKFTKQSNLTFENKTLMLEAKEYIESLLMMAQFSF